MLIDTQPVSSWYVLSLGFKVYEACPKCQSTQLVYNKARISGFKGIACHCQNCHKELPVRFKAIQSEKIKIQVS